MSELTDGLSENKWGAASVLLGGIALLVSSLVIFAGPFAPQQTVGVTIGQIIGEISLSAMNTVRGEAPPAPVAQVWDIDRIMAITGPALAVLAFLAATISYVRHHKGRLPVFGTALAVAAITMQFLWWVALLIAGAIVLASIVANGAGFLDL